MALLSFVFHLCLLSAAAQLQPAPDGHAKAPSTTKPPATEVQTPRQVDVKPSARDDQIGQRLESILTATEWFQDVDVRVREGVVFLTGVAEKEEYRKWATELAHNTQDVVAVVNKMEARRSSLWDLSPVLASLREIWTNVLQGLPYFLIGIVVMIATVIAARYTRRGAERLVARRVTIPLLRDAVGKTAAIVVLIVGLYLVLKISGTTQLALTVLGGTGLFGLVLGIAFRDITENFLASVFLSMQQPFRVGDLVEIVGITGYVDRLTVRTTVVIAFDGNYVQIPNSTVYKSTIRNFSNNPKRRDDFTVAIPFGKPLSEAQETALRTLNDHPAVLKQPEPWILVHSVDSSRVDLKVYYWFDCLQNNMLTVRSSVMRLVIDAFVQAKLLDVPGPAAMVFPRGIDVHLNRDPAGAQGPELSQEQSSAANAPPAAATKAEGTLENRQVNQISQQAKQARPVEAGPNLLPGSLDGVASNAGAHHDRH